MNFHLLTIFPEILNSYFNESILKRAQASGIINLYKHNLRDYTEDNHKTVDDTPYGGGAGMVMKVDVLYRALGAIESIIKNQESRITVASHDSKLMIHNSKIVLLSAKGRRWTQQKAKEYSLLDNVIFICGRYEGVDERITKFIDEEISIGDFVLTGGELGAAIIIDSITRLLPGALGNSESAISESHTVPGTLEYPQYTRPEIFTAEGKKYKVPKVLLSGNHAEIEKWRQGKMKKCKK
jgi:tRNA (guanine37-N1)-methyltransferase